jgi:hypothetical protein
MEEGGGPHHVSLARLEQQLTLWTLHTKRCKAYYGFFETTFPVSNPSTPHDALPHAVPRACIFLFYFFCKKKERWNNLTISLPPSSSSVKADSMEVTCLICGPALFTKTISGGSGGGSPNCLSRHAIRHHPELFGTSQCCRIVPFFSPNFFFFSPYIHTSRLRLAMT